MEQDLLTESRNPASERIDAVPTVDMLRVINAADAQVAEAVSRELDAITRAVDGIVERMESGGRLIYIGAGTSGRLGVLDASECPPTFNTPAGLVLGLIAGGDRALRQSIEGAEDDPQQGAADLAAHTVSARDAVVGIAASGRTPYVLGGIRYARDLGCLTIGVSCTTNSKLAQIVDVPITPVPGPEVITGSTRMRAGTATKLVLNMLSTGAMIRLGYVYGNLMVNVQATNDKLVDRSRRIIATIAGVSYDEASRLLTEAGSVRTAVVMHERKMTKERAEALLAERKGRLRDALAKQ